MPRYRLQARNIFLTYPQADGLTRQQLVDHLRGLLPVKHILVAQERHADEGIHYHCVVECTRKIDTRNARFFDLDGKHPNAQACRVLKDTYEYAKKDDDEAIDTFPNGYFVDKPKWFEIVSGSATAEQFLAAVRVSYPRDYALSYSRLVQFAAAEFRPPLVSYESRYTDFILPQSVADWYSANFIQPRPERPKSLCLIGPSRTGKTCWARSLGDHVYWNTYYNIDEFDTTKSYLVIDDLGWDRLPAFKALLGSQLEFTLTDKYRHKKTFKNWGNPAIVCLNPDQDYRISAGLGERRWLEANVVFVDIQNKMF